MSVNVNANVTANVGEYCEYYSHSQLLSAVEVRQMAL